MSRLMALAALLLTAPGAHAQAPAIAHAQLASTVRIRFYKSAVTPGEFKTARRLVDDILGAAGIGVSWLQCWPGDGLEAAIRAACERPPGLNDIILRVVRAGDANSASHVESLGFALVDGRLKAGTMATVYSDRVAALAHYEGARSSDLLAHAIAHEIGHLLLGTNEHGENGLMRAVWSRAELRRNAATDWRFSDGQATTMRRAIALRATGSEGPR